jgi:branched-chain amino acid transport system substrate-binding protein
MRFGKERKMRGRLLTILVILGIGILMVWWYLELRSHKAPSPPPVLPVEAPRAPELAPPPVREAVKIGAVIPLSGPEQTKGAEIKRALELALAKAEETLGLKIELLIEDDKGEASQTENLIRKQVLEENVLAVISGAVKEEVAAHTGVPDGWPVRAAGQLAQELSVPVILLNSSDEALLAESSYLFGLGLGPEDEAVAAARFAGSTLGLKYAGILVDIKDTRLRNAATTAREVFETHGGQVVSQVACVTGDEDFSGQIKRIKARGAQVLLLLAGADEGARVISQARKANLNIPIIATSRMRQPLHTGGPYGPQVTGLDRNVLGRCFITGYFGAGEQREALVSLQQSLGEVELTDTLALAYDAFSLVAQALKAAPVPTRENMVLALGAIENFPGVTGSLSFKETGAVMRDIAVMQIGGEVRSRFLPFLVTLEVQAPAEIELP